ncbi:MAG: terminase family protein [Paracoccaceae bacterium]
MSNDLGLFVRTLNERVQPERLLERVVDGPPDPWQTNLMNSTADIIMVLASRRIGKSTTIGVMAGQELTKPEHQVVILSKTLAQSQLLFAKIAYTWEKMALPIEIKRRTMTELHLANGSSVVCVPAGQDGGQARGYGVKNGLLLYDEAAFVPDAVYGSTLAIAEDNAKTILITTPGGKSGKAYAMWTDYDMYPEVERIRACSLDIPRMAKLVARQRKTLSKLEFSVEHELRWMGKGSPFFDPDTISGAFTNTPQLKLGNIYDGISATR